MGSENNEAIQQPGMSEEEGRIHVKPGMSEKEYRLQTLERYSGCSADDFRSKLLLTNFPKYLNHFAESRGNLPIIEGASFRVVHDPESDTSMVDFKVGSPAAALAVDLLSAVQGVKATVFLGMVGGLRKRYKIGEYLVPVAAIRGDGTSDAYMLPEVPALANFLMQRAVLQTLEKKEIDHHIGITYTGNVRVWEYDEQIREKLMLTKAQGKEMECATLFVASYKRKFTLGALLLISDLPLEKAKSKEDSKKLYAKHTGEHIDLGCAVLDEALKMELKRVKGAYQATNPKEFEVKRGVPKKIEEETKKKK